MLKSIVAFAFALLANMPAASGARRLQANVAVSVDVRHSCSVEVFFDHVDVRCAAPTRVHSPPSFALGAGRVRSVEVEF